MNKKRLIGYLFVLMSVAAFMRRKRMCLHKNINYGMTARHRYGQKHYLWEMDAWEPWFMGHQGQNKYN